MLVVGGRNEHQLFADVWKLEAFDCVDGGEIDNSCEHAVQFVGGMARSPRTEEEGVTNAPSLGLRWRREVDLELPVSRCAHGVAVIGEAGGAGELLCVFGGFTGEGVRTCVCVCEYTCGCVQIYICGCVQVHLYVLLMIEFLHRRHYSNVPITPTPTIIIVVIAIVIAPHLAFVVTSSLRHDFMSSRSYIG